MHYIKQSIPHWSHWLTKKNERRSFSLTSLAIPSANSRAAVLLRSTVKELLIAGYMQFSGSISRGDSNLSYLFPKLATSNFSQKYTYHVEKIHEADDSIKLHLLHAMFKSRCSQGPWTLDFYTPVTRPPTVGVNVNAS